MKLNQSTLFFIILAIALLSALGMNIKEGLTSDRITRTREKYRDEMARRVICLLVMILNMNSFGQRDEEFVAWTFQKVMKTCMY